MRRTTCPTPGASPMRQSRMTPALFELVAARFKAFGEPARLRILHALADGERTVSELVRRTGIAQANLSRHLQQLLAMGFVARHKRVLFAYYRLADTDVLRLCELMCGRLEQETMTRRGARQSA